MIQVIRLNNMIDKKEYYKNKKVDKKYQTLDGLGEIYQKQANGECICYFASASCPIHGISTSIYSTSLTNICSTSLTEINEKI